MLQLTNNTAAKSSAENLKLTSQLLNSSAGNGGGLGSATSKNSLNPNVTGAAASITGKDKEQQPFQFSQPFQFNPNHSFVNPKIINDSNKFIENILAHSKRNLKPPPSLRVNNSDSRNQLQLLSASLNLPPNIITINRTNEERFLFPDKLILERFKSII